MDEPRKKALYIIILFENVPYNEALSSIMTLFSDTRRDKVGWFVKKLRSQVTTSLKASARRNLALTWSHYTAILIEYEGKLYARRPLWSNLTFLIIIIIIIIIIINFY